MFSQIDFAVKNNVAKIRLNRPEAYNAFSDTMKEEFISALEEIKSNREVRVVVLTGTGKVFSAGGDVRNMANNLNQSFLERRDVFRQGMGVIVRKLKSIRQPVIAAVNGVAAGAGCSLALACDLRYASSTARFGLMFVKRGLAPDWGSSYFLPRLVGLANALELVFTGRIIDAQKALEMGMVNEVVPPEELEGHVEKVCAEIVANAPVAVAAAKEEIYYGTLHCLDEALEMETYVQSMCQLTEDFKEGVMSFLEKRPASFHGA